MLNYLSDGLKLGIGLGMSFAGAVFGQIFTDAWLDASAWEDADPWND